MPAGLDVVYALAIVGVVPFMTVGAVDGLIARVFFAAPLMLLATPKASRQLFCFSTFVYVVSPLLTVRTLDWLINVVM